jgi:hypothetical protein
VRSSAMINRWISSLVIGIFSMNYDRLSLR